ncbi:hypothetical protein QYE76_026610 [Lolium multiflorum]|uniref:Uncharacterized protein n=1 Tax=Lolium multiflorum TaxID=4521 RepID=A0AAD8VY53_LOLMU|nr:hypothetical protein QYE76_026610 [Lolium multiflorum]
MSSSTSSATVLAAALGSPPSQLLTRDNALIWKALVIPALRGARVLDLVEGKEEAPEKILETKDINKKKVTIENPEYSAWISRDQQVLRWILNALSPDVLAHVVGLETSAEAWAAITAHVSSTSKTRVHQLRSALNDTQKMISLLKRKPRDADDLISYVLKDLGSHYNTIRTAVNANPGTTLDDLLSQVQVYDRMHKADEGFTSSANVAPRDGAPPRGPDHPRQDDRPRQQQYDERPRYDDRGRGDDRGRQDYRDRRDYRDHRDDQVHRDGGGYQGRRYDDEHPRRRNDEDRCDGGGRGGRRDHQPTPYVNTTCQICDIHGHPARDCWWRYGDDPRGDGDRGNKGANFTGVDTNWYYDTGGTDHITSELSKLHTHDKFQGTFPCGQRSWCGFAWVLARSRLVLHAGAPLSRAPICRGPTCCARVPARVRSDAGTPLFSSDADTLPNSDNTISPGSSVAHNDVPPDVPSPAVSSAGSSTMESDAPAAAPPSSPPGPRTRLHKGEPRNLPDALKDTQWRAAMQDEYDALMLNKTCRYS